MSAMKVFICLIIICVSIYLLIGNKINERKILKKFCEDRGVIDFEKASDKDILSKLTKNIGKHSIFYLSTTEICAEGKIKEVYSDHVTIAINYSDNEEKIISYDDIDFIELNSFIKKETA